MQPESSPAESGPETGSESEPESDPPSDAAPRLASHDGPQRVLLVTGLLGAGKSTALRALEDLGWEIIDNFPIRLLRGLIDRTSPRDAEIPGPLAIGFDSRTRGFDPAAIIQQVKTLSVREDIELTTLYLDCASGELERRYNETRRRHPLASDMPASAGIRAEREMLEPLRRWADLLIDTTGLSANELQQVMRERFASPKDRPLTVTVSSFGFSRGMPPLADLVFDMRFLPNPFWVPELKPLTGLDAPVAAYVLEQEGAAPFLDRVTALMKPVLSGYLREGRRYATIGIGCTGGKHRSVAIAEALATQLADDAVETFVVHRDLGRE